MVAAPICHVNLCYSSFDLFLEFYEDLLSDMFILQKSTSFKLPQAEHSRDEAPRGQFGKLCSTSV